MDFILYLKIIGWILLGIVVLYIIVKLTRNLKVVESAPASQFGETIADQFYYLPGYGMNINATASLIIFRDGEGKFLKHKIQSLTLETEVVLEPDTSQLIALTYKPDIYASDDFTITTSSDSLLQNISSVTEDRLPIIIKDFIAAPEQVLQEAQGGRAMLERGRATLVSETIEVKKAFKVDASHVSGGGVKLVWQISIEGKDDKLDISQTLKNKSASRRARFSKKFEGILTRPMSYQTWELESSDTPDASFTCFGPDASRLIKVPIRRGYFIKKQQMPKFSSGILVENHFTKESEVEGVASIPINILKAIVSIPSEIFRFRILRNNLETELEQSVLEKLKAKDDLAAQQKKSIDDLTKKVHELQQAPVEQGTVIPLLDADNIPPLGKLSADELPADADKKEEGLLRSAKTRTRALRNENEVEEKEAFDIPCFWNNKFTGDWLDYGNKIGGVKSCVPAAAAHMITCWSSNTAIDATVIPPNIIEDVYKREGNHVPGNPASDKGCFPGSFLLHWKTLGIGTNKIILAANITAQSVDVLKRAISLFGPCMIGFKMPLTA